MSLVGPKGFSSKEFIELIKTAKSDLDIEKVLFEVFQKGIDEGMECIRVNAEHLVRCRLKRENLNRTNLHAWISKHGIVQWRKEGLTDGMQDWERVPSLDKLDVLL